MKVLVSGSSGFVGSALISFLVANGDQVYRLVRRRGNLSPGEMAWDSRHGVVNPLLLEGMDVVIHLAGETIYGRWTEAKKKEIWESRVNGTRLLCQAVNQLQQPPSVFICASAIGYYGNRGEERLVEQSPKGKGFLADVSEAWEEATRGAVEKGIRTINLRLGMVLSAKGGALKALLPLFRWGLGGRIGNGQQYMSWIAMDDLVRVIGDIIHQPSLAGPINAVTPYPVTNREFTETLGRVLHRPTPLPLPAFAVKLIFGEMGEELILSSVRVYPEKLERIGFHFNYPHLEEALHHLLM